MQFCGSTRHPRRDTRETWETKPRFASLTHRWVRVRHCMMHSDESLIHVELRDHHWRRTHTEWHMMEIWMIYDFSYVLTRGCFIYAWFTFHCLQRCFSNLACTASENIHIRLSPSTPSWQTLKYSQPSVFSCRQFTQEADLLYIYNK